MNTLVDFQKQKEKRIKEVTEHITSTEEWLKEQLKNIEETKTVLRWYKKDLEELNSLEFEN